MSLAKLAIFILVLHYCNAFCPSSLCTNYFDHASDSIDHATITRNAIHNTAVKWFNRNAATYCTGPFYLFNSTKSISDIFSQCYAGLVPTNLPDQSLYGINDVQYQNDVFAVQDSNAAVDTDDHTGNDPVYHFDGETFNDANVYLVKVLYSIRQVITSGKYVVARTLLGQALHTVQDFYAHSNWIEQGNYQPKFSLGHPNAFSPIDLAGSGDETCMPCEVHYNTSEAFAMLPWPENVFYWKTRYYGGIYECNSNLATNLLTSGYFDTSVAGKCASGGVYDSSAQDAPGGGINKNTDNVLYSPHHQLHHIAAGMATDATEQLLIDLWDFAGDENFGSLFNLIFSDKRDLAFAIDTTGSMEGYIDAAKAASFAIIDSSVSGGDRPHNFILVPFNDPGFGPVFTTTDPAVFKDNINVLYADGGGDCPEQCYAGILQAAYVASPGTPLFVFTDATSKQPELLKEIEALALKNALSINFITNDNDCGYVASVENGTSLLQQQQGFAIEGAFGDAEVGTLDQYYQLASLTGGLVLSSSYDQSVLAQTAQVIQRSLSPQRIEIASLRELVGDAIIEIPVDSTMASFSIISSRTNLEGGYVINLELTNPAGVRVPSNYIIATSSTKMVSTDIDDVTKYGVWQLYVRFLNSPDRERLKSNVTVFGISSFDISLQLHVPSLTPQMGFRLVEGNPIANTTAWFTLRKIGVSPMPFDQVLFLDSLGHRLINYSCDYDDLTQCQFKTTVPIEKFFVVAQLRDPNGYLVQRMVTQSIVPTYIDLTATFVNTSQIFYPGQSGYLSFNVTNLGGGSNFEFYAHDSLSFVQSINPSTSYIASGDTILGSVFIDVPESATVHTTSSLQLVAQTTSGFDDNFLQISIIVGQKVFPDIDAPVCSILTESLTTSCAAVPGNYCTEANWSAEMVFSDHGSGLLKATGRYSNGKATWNIDAFTPGTADVNFTASVNGDCCVSNATLTVVDKVGWTGTCFLTAPPIWFLTTTTTTTTMMPTSTIAPTTTAIPTSSTTTAGTTEPTTSSSDCIGNSFSCAELPDGTYQDSGCSCAPHVIYCSNHITYVVSCPANLVYNPITKKCDYSANVHGC